MGAFDDHLRTPCTGRHVASPMYISISILTSVLLLRLAVDEMSVFGNAISFIFAVSLGGVPFSIEITV